MDDAIATPPSGRRERKKARTRQTLADEALRLFSERGFDQVTVAEVAEAADVAVSTLFAHYPTKESLLFSKDATIGAGFVQAVTARDPATTVLEALRAYVHRAPDLASGRQEFVDLVRATPALTRYVDRMWSRHADDLCQAIAAATGVAATDVAARALARYVVEIPSIVRSDPDRHHAIDAVFDLLARGWQGEPQR
jgi:AcrR family transcriptional regulator